MCCGPLAAELEEEADTAVGGNTLRRRRRERELGGEARGAWGEEQCHQKGKQVHSTALVPKKSSTGMLKEK